MPRHPDFQKIHARFVKQYGKERGESLYYAWLKKKGYAEEKPFPKKEKKEKQCIVKGVEMKEMNGEFHIEGLIATTHIDDLDKAEGIDVPDKLEKETLDDWSDQMNQNFESRVMGVHHSEGRAINPQYYGEADVEKNPTKVVPLQGGHWGLFVDTKMLMDDPQTPEIVKDWQEGKLNSFSVTYDTHGFETTDFDWVDGKLVRLIKPGTKLYGYTASDLYNEEGGSPVNPNAVATNLGFKEFKELMNVKPTEEVTKMSKKEMKEETPPAEEETASAEEPDKKEEKPEEKVEEKKAEGAEGEDTEKKEFLAFKKYRKDQEEKEMLNKVSAKVADDVLKKLEVKEKVMKNPEEIKMDKLPLEFKEYRAALTKPEEIEVKEQFTRAANVCGKIGLDWQKSTTTPVEQREFKNFSTNGRKLMFRDLEFKGLGLTTNQNADTDYLQSSAELQDVYDPVIYNALNQETVTWNLLAKDDMSKKGNNMVQFTLKTVANASAQFYTGNSVSTGPVTRLKYQTKFKKVQVGVSVDGDMIAAAKGGPVDDVFAQEVLDSTMDMLAVVNAALFGVKGAETDAECIGFEYLADDANYTTLYSLTRSSANKLAPDSSTDNFVNQSSTIVSMANLRTLKRNATDEGAKKRNLVYITNPLQGDMMRGKFDDSRRMLTTRDTGFGFATDLFIDGIPVFEDIDCNTDDWFCVDLDSHRVGIWVPPTIERLGKTQDAEDAFIKMYFATFNRLPRAIGQLYGCATS